MHVAVTQDTNVTDEAATVRCSLWSDGLEIQSTDLWLGTCTSTWQTDPPDGPEYTYACGKNEHCDNVANDPDADIGPCITSGKANYQTGQMSVGFKHYSQYTAGIGAKKGWYRLEHVTIDLGDPNSDNKYSRVVNLNANADGTVGWTEAGSCVAGDHYNCVDDSDLEDGDGLYDGGKPSQEFLGLENPAVDALEPNEGIPDDAAVFFTPYIGRHSTGPTDERIEVRGGISDGGETAAKIQWGRLSRAAKEDQEWHMDAAVMARTDPNGNAWTATTLNAMRAVIERRQGVADKVRTPRFVVQTEIERPPPPPHLTLSDQNGDGKIVVSFSGDSLLAAKEIQGRMPAALRQPERIYLCVQGGVRSWHLSADFASHLDGSSGTYIPCAAIKGPPVGDDPDYTFMQIGYNDLEPRLVYPTSGYCYDYSDPNANPPTAGPQHGNPCRLPTGHRTGWDTGAGVGGYYCVRGPDYKSGPGAADYCSWDPNATRRVARMVYVCRPPALAEPIWSYLR
jgi:hypothetical protein